MRSSTHIFYALFSISILKLFNTFLNFDLLWYNDKVQLKYIIFFNNEFAAGWLFAIILQSSNWFRQTSMVIAPPHACMYIREWRRCEDPTECKW